MPENLTDFEENRLLDLSVVPGDYVALLTTVGSDSDPGVEVVGAGYGRAAVVMGAAGGGSRASSAPHVYLDMPAVEVQGWAIMTAAAGGDRRWYGLFNSHEGTAEAAVDTITSVGHGLVDDAKIVFQEGFVPPGLAASTTYYLVGATTDTFQVAATLGGAAIDITADSDAVAFGTVATVNAGEVFAIPTGSLVISLT